MECVCVCDQEPVAAPSPDLETGPAAACGPFYSGSRFACAPPKYAAQVGVQVSGLMLACRIAWSSAGARVGRSCSATHRWMVLALWICCESAPSSPLPPLPIAILALSGGPVFMRFRMVPDANARGLKGHRGSRSFGPRVARLFDSAAYRGPHVCSASSKRPEWSSVLRYVVPALRGLWELHKV